MFLKATGEIRSVIKEGKRYHSPHFVLYSLDRRSQKALFPRLGISIAKKHVHLAVQRNRIKRVIKEFWRKRDKKASSKDFVLIIKKETDTLKNADIFAELHNFVNKNIS